jgi:hypothetical protein
MICSFTVTQNFRDRRWATDGSSLCLRSSVVSFVFPPGQYPKGTEVTPWFGVLSKGFLLGVPGYAHDSVTSMI